MRKLLAVALGILYVSALRGSELAEPSDLAALSMEELIARLQEVSAQSVGANNLVWAGGFIALDAPPTFRGGVLGTPAPAVPPAMRELVRRGATVLPALLDHLTDARPTKLTAGSSGQFQFMAAWYADEYDPRDRAKPPADLHRAGAGTMAEQERFEHHQVKVGDLCFVALGQIVNRSLLAVRYQPSACLVVNSPVKTPRLAAAARADWHDLTAGEFKDFLIKDTTYRNPDVYTSNGALQRLLFYFPSDGEPLAIRWLGYPLINVKPVQEFLDGRLRSADETEQDRLLAAFRADHGEAYYQKAVEALIQTAELLRQAGNVHSGTIEPYQYTIRLVDRRFADASQRPPPDIRVENCADRLRLVEALMPFPSAGLDQAVRDLLKRTLELQPSDRTDQYSQFELAAACARRLSPPARRDEISRATERLRSELPSEQADAKTLETYNRHYQSFLQGLTTVLSSKETTP